jgi:hypothetical protein
VSTVEDKPKADKKRKPAKLESPPPKRQNSDAERTKKKASPAESDKEEDNVKIAIESPTIDGPAVPSAKGEEQLKQEVIDEEEEYSDVIDEPPAPKRKKGVKKEAKPKNPKTAKPAKAPSKPSGDSGDSDEAEIKRLQSQLTKCGIRKLWHNELKKYGDESKPKIRHLRKMLADIGMDGRFSEAKAREIKEMRELAAEVEATQEMNELWGMGTGGRASRSKARGIQVDGAGDSDEEAKPGKDSGDVEDEDDDDDKDEAVSFAARRRRAQADLAFLGDDSDSD